MIAWNIARRKAAWRFLADLDADIALLQEAPEPPADVAAKLSAAVFSRMAALGLSFVGPQAPAGRRAEPWPDELPRTSNNVPTYHATHQTPATCTRQLDFVFASNRLVERVRVRALNEPEQWGPSDHCRVEIEVE